MSGVPGSVRGPSLAGRMAAAIALTAGFYLLALAMVVGLVALAVVPWLHGSGRPALSIISLVIAGGIAVAIVPRRIRFEPPGPQLAPNHAPGLHAMLAEEAQAAGERLPDEVYLTLEVNAAVLEIGRHRRVLIVGLPLLRLLSQRGLRSVIAHELGHYAGGDTRLGGWIYRTRETIGRTLERLSKSMVSGTWEHWLVRLPFVWYGKAFLRITAAISRRQEFAADACAAHRAGRDVHVATLRTLEAYAPAFDAYWGTEVAPLLQMGFRPPVAAGFAEFIAAPRVIEAAQRQLEGDLAQPETSPYDSHPSLPERIAAVETLPPGDPDDSRPAIELLADPAALELRLLKSIAGHDADDLEGVAWDRVGEEVYLVQAQAHADRVSAVLTGYSLAELPEALEAAPGVLVDSGDAQPEEAPRLAVDAVTAGLTAALARAGWRVEAPPGVPVLCRRGEDALVPWEVVGRLQDGTLPAADWRARAAALGIADVRLHETTPAPTAAQPAPAGSSAAPASATASAGPAASAAPTTPAA